MSMVENLRVALTVMLAHENWIGEWMTELLNEDIHNVGLAIQ